ncbi:MAG: 4-alpha-glucanotransferase, partial [Candidatus Omnitrophota bacterium]
GTLEDISGVYQVKDALTGENYRNYAVWQLLRSGLPIGVPTSGIQVLDLIKTGERRAKTEKDITPRNLVDVIKAAIEGKIIRGVYSPAELLSEIVSGNLNGLEGILREVSKLKPETAKDKFTEAGIPAVMAFVATLAPRLLEDMKDWDSQVYILLDSVVNSGLNKDIFEKGEIKLHQVTLNTAFVFSKSYNGRRIFIPIHFMQKNYSSGDLKVWLKITDMDSLGYAEDSLPHKIFDYTLGYFYPIPHTGKDLAKYGWNVGIPVFPGNIDRSGYIQHGWRFQILELDPVLPENIAWWKDPLRINTAMILPIFSLRNKENDPGIGKFTGLGPYFKKAASEGVNTILLLPFYAALSESPYAIASLYALNELYIDWSRVKEAEGYAALLAAPAGEGEWVHYDSIRRREGEIALQAFRNFKDDRTERAESFRKFAQENGSWLEDYAEFMALREIIGRQSLEWREADVKAAKADPRYQDLAGTHKFAQWVAYRQFKDAVDSVHKQGGHLLFDIPMFRGKDSVDAWKYPRYFKDIRTKNPGIIRSCDGINEDWKDLALWKWSELSRNNYEFILKSYRYWLDFGLDGLRLDALHFAYKFGNGQLSSDDEPGDEFIALLGRLALLSGKVFMAEAFEGKLNDIRKYGIMAIGEDWKQMSSHDTPRCYHTKQSFMEAFNNLTNDYYTARNARFIAFTLGDQWGDSVPVKEVRNSEGACQSFWRYRVPVESDPNYAERVKFDLSDYLRTKVSAQEAYRRLNSAAELWGYPHVISAILRYAAGTFIQKPGNETQIWAGSIGWFFEEWGRDTFISMPGLLFATGRFEEAKQIIRGFVRYEKNGLIPNLVRKDTIEYNNVDATMWFIHAVRKYAQYTGDWDFVREMLPVMRSIISNYRRGTGYYRNGEFQSIYMDKDDALIVNPAQATWMDADPNGNSPITPRNGKTVETNSLWYANLKFIGAVEEKIGGHAASVEYNSLAEKVKNSFNNKFWNETEGALYDVIEGDQHKGAIRPNMIIAVSCAEGLLSPERQISVFNAVTKELLTPYGLRTLSPKDPSYHPHYDTWAPMPVKDQAYHQGTVWPWLFGPYIDALAKVRAYEGKSEKDIRDEIRSLLINPIKFLFTSPYCSLPEVFDGDSPHNPGGNPSQAWSVAEVLRVLAEYKVINMAERYPAAVDRKAIRHIPVSLRNLDIRATVAIKEGTPGISYRNNNTLTVEEEDLLLKALRDAYIGLANAPPEASIPLLISYNLNRVAEVSNGYLKVNRFILNTKNKRPADKASNAIRITLSEEILPHELKHRLGLSEEQIRSESKESFTRNPRALEALLYLHRNKINGITLDSDWLAVLEGIELKRKAALTEYNPLDVLDDPDLPEPGPEQERKEDWIKRAVIYEIDVRGYALVRLPDGSVKEGTLIDIEKNLENICEMIRGKAKDGVIPTLYLKGVYPIGQKDRKYDGSQFSIKNHMAVNPETGTEEEFDRLVSRAHSLGMRVIIDAV